ncbi:Type II/IV secretion system protein TadC, associated with Flp pilus assembly [hydrothermal vent metagenome]|uniref:Type II/IV secretion system protein TadC, associated with Flp pilus assembly n=1 Tax=hydrothermal vent metagenome TaxID=652676 RepID=A0A3B0RL94_9ZZZZ
MDFSLKSLVDPEFMVTVFAAIVTFATVITIIGPMFGGDKLAGRLKSVATRREKLRQQNRAAIGNKTNLRGESKGFMTDVVGKLNLQKLLEDNALQTRLMQAGLRGQGPIMTFYFFRLVAPIALFVISLFYFFVVNDFGKPPMVRVAMSTGMMLLGYYAPGIYVSNIAAKRRESIMKAFPDALDLLLICVESGMSVEAAFGKVAAEVGSNSIELAEEMSLTTAELSYLSERRQAYENLGRRTNHPGVQAVATSLIQAEKYGTPVGTSLRVMAKENRDMRMSAAEKKAASLPAKLTVPMIIFFLPVLFVVVLGPAIIKFQQLK